MDTHIILDDMAHTLHGMMLRNWTKACADTTHKHTSLQYVLCMYIYCLIHTFHTKTCAHGARIGTNMYIYTNLYAYAHIRTRTPHTHTHTHTHTLTASILPCSTVVLADGGSIRTHAHDTCVCMCLYTCVCVRVITYIVWWLVWSWLYDYFWQL